MQNGKESQINISVDLKCNASIHIELGSGIVACSEGRLPLKVRQGHGHSRKVSGVSGIDLTDEVISDFELMILGVSTK